MNNNLSINDSADAEVISRPQRVMKYSPIFDEYGSAVATVSIPGYVADQIHGFKAPFIRVDLTKESLTDEEKDQPHQRQQSLLQQRRKHVIIQVGFVPCGEHIAWLFRVVEPENAVESPRQTVWHALDSDEKQSLLDGIVQTVDAVMARGWN